jgi:hypothetical protein
VVWGNLFCVEDLAQCISDKRCGIRSDEEGFGPGIMGVWNQILDCIALLRGNCFSFEFLNFVPVLLCANCFS